MFHREFKWGKMCFMFLDTLNEPNFHPPVRNSTVQYDNIYVILWLRFSNYNQTKALNQTLPKIYIRWSKSNGEQRYDRKHKKTLNSLNCTSVFLDTSTIQKNTSIIHGLSPPISWIVLVFFWIVLVFTSYLMRSITYSFSIDSLWNFARA